jgi:hypothetical protein
VKRGLVGPLALVLLALGIGLRVLVAWHLAGRTGEWEADGFVRAWEGQAWGAWNRVRPPLTGWVLQSLVGSERSVFAVRLVCIGVSVAGLLAALWTASRLVRVLRAPPRAPRLAGCWLTGWWAVFPTLVSGACRPTPELLLGPLLTLLLGALVAWDERPHVGHALLVLVSATAALLAGGIVVAAVLVVGLAVYLLKLPRLRASLPVLLMIGGALAAAWLVQRGPDPSRPWQPDTAPALSLGALLDVPLAAEPDLVNADARAERWWRHTREGLEARGPLDVLRRYALRLTLDELGPARFDDWGLQDRGLSALPVGFADVFVRGGLLLFALATLTLVRRTTESSLPRAAVAVALLLLAPLLVVTACSPLALAPFDLPLLTLAAAGVAAADPGQAGLRWAAFFIGGALLLALPVAGYVSGRPPAEWVTKLGAREQQDEPALPGTPGRRLVAVLQGEGPVDAPRQLQAARLMRDPLAPFVRLAEASRAHALAASVLDPTAAPVLTQMVASHCENGDFEAAETLARSLLDASGAPTRDSDLLVDWVRQAQYDLRAAESRGPPPAPPLSPDR